MSPVEAINRLRGHEGTSVTISILREGASEPIEFTLPREHITLPSVRWTRLPNDIGYIRLKEFSEMTAGELEAALLALEAQNMRALVLDLRDNSGGGLGHVIAVADKFLPGGQLIVSIKGRRADQKWPRVSTEKPAPRQYPLLILVNKGSAAGSEIVAGALQELQRACILGTPTFGDASLQTIVPLRDGSGLRLTTARYVTPKGRSIQGIGITPDILVESPPSQGGARTDQSKPVQAASGTPRGAKTFAQLMTDVQLQRAVEILNAEEPCIPGQGHSR